MKVIHFKDQNLFGSMPFQQRPHVRMDLKEQKNQSNYLRNGRCQTLLQMQHLQKRIRFALFPNTLQKPQQVKFATADLHIVKGNL